MMEGGARRRQGDKRQELCTRLEQETRGGEGHKKKEIDK